ncbi:hypothetical protein HK096_001144, partial [Nowakowskiella sp. JEL0078]
MSELGKVRSYGVTLEEDEEEGKILNKTQNVLEKLEIDEKKLEKDSGTDASSIPDVSLPDPQIVIKPDLASCTTSDESISNQSLDNINSEVEGKSESESSKNNLDIELSPKDTFNPESVQTNIDPTEVCMPSQPSSPSAIITKLENNSNSLLNVRMRFGFSSKSRSNSTSPSPTVSAPPSAITSPVLKPQTINRPLVRGKAYKRYLMHSLPKILVVNLKRFTQIGHSGRTKKVEDFVSFNDVIDMQDFLAPSNVIMESTRKQTKQILKNLDQLTEKIKSENQLDLADRISEINKMRNIVKKQMDDSIEKSQTPTTDTQYQLYGVAVHSGSLLSGHYVVCQDADTPAENTLENFETAHGISESVDQLKPDVQSNYGVIRDGLVEKLSG